ncbi:hypothetical protein E9536_40465 [Burkholderia sp. LS-044]|uniref:hypothetical protein n=1 Tax=Burkholderia sp. LS-044 TaxID=1459967 RepID=UPI0010A63B09|nr:hypothetical protein [Burkholderia sp. LS-044]THJ45970.1 hypothetical protein E9536_40465 [Burkholderia sp. LS-044]
MEPKSVFEFDLGNRGGKDAQGIAVEIIRITNKTEFQWTFDSIELAPTLEGGENRVIHSPSMVDGIWDAMPPKTIGPKETAVFKFPERALPPISLSFRANDKVNTLISVNLRNRFVHGELPNGQDWKTNWSDKFPEEETAKLDNFVAFKDRAAPERCPDGFFSAAVSASLRNFEGPTGHPTEVRVSVYRHPWTKNLKFLSWNGNEFVEFKGVSIGDDGKIRLTLPNHELIYQASMETRPAASLGSDVWWSDRQVHCTCRGWAAHLDFPAVFTTSGFYYSVQVDYLKDHPSVNLELRSELA